MGRANLKKSQPVENPSIKLSKVEMFGYKIG